MGKWSCIIWVGLVYSKGPAKREKQEAECVMWWHKQEIGGSYTAGFEGGGES